MIGLCAWSVVPSVLKKHMQAQYSLDPLPDCLFDLVLPNLKLVLAGWLKPSWCRIVLVQIVFHQSKTLQKKSSDAIEESFYWLLKTRTIEHSYKRNTCGTILPRKINLHQHHRHQTFKQIITYLLELSLPKSSPLSR